MILILRLKKTNKDPCCFYLPQDISLTRVDFDKSKCKFLSNPSYSLTELYLMNILVLEEGMLRLHHVFQSNRLPANWDIGLVSHLVQFVLQLPLALRPISSCMLPTIFYIYKFLRDNRTRAVQMLTFYDLDGMRRFFISFHLKTEKEWNILKMNIFIWV